jgi:gluconate 2-dehydrogenase gamma chain
MKRRDLLARTAIGFGGLLIYDVGARNFVAGETTPTVSAGFRFFSSQEAAVIEAACDRIFPADDSGPGAREARVVVYIDRQLHGPFGHDRYRYTQEPFVDSVPEHGYQGKATPREVYREGMQVLGSDFHTLDSAVQDERLRNIENTYFFRMLRTHTIQGMFSDPLHGGNSNMVGWQLVGYPGPLMSYRDQVFKTPVEPFRQKPVSLEQVIGSPVKGWEDE